MAINQLIAQGIAPIGRDLPQIGQMLQQKKQQEQQNALAQMAAQTDQQNVTLRGREFDIQAKAAQRKQAQEWLTANYERVQNTPGALQKGIAYGKQQGFLRPDLPETATIEDVAMELGVAAPAAPVTLSSERVGGFNVLRDSTGKVINSQAPERAGGGASEMFSPVTLADGGIGAFDRRSGRVVPTGQYAPPKGADDPMKLRKEFEGSEASKDFRKVLPLLVSARKMPDTGAGDLGLIYTTASVLDPDSVVRESEQVLIIKSGTMMAQLFGAGRFQLGKGGRIPPEQRQQLLSMLNERALGYRQAYDQERERYSSYAKDSGSEPSKVVGPHPANAFKSTPAPGGPAKKRFRVDAEGNVIGN